MGALLNRRRLMGEVKVKPYLKFIAIEDGTFQYPKALEYSLDNGRTWVALAANTATPTVQTGNTILWRGSYTTGIANNTFVSTGRFNVEGDPRSVSAGDNFESAVPSYCCCYRMFQDCTKLVSARNIILSSLTAPGNYCGRMFQGCTSLTEIPDILPATTLNTGCYYYMFSGCTSLTSAPILPATTLAQDCYSYMFQGCTALTTAPEIPATTTAKTCCAYMFSGCTALTIPPSELPATTLANACYDFMFYTCSNLTSTPLMAPTILAENCCRRMFSNCTNLTTVKVTLPATTLTTNCYARMFYGCKYITAAPELPALTLATNCYLSMFDQCTRLNYIKAMFTTDPSTVTGCLENWVRGVASSGVFIKNPAATWDVRGIHGVPTNWSIAYEIEYLESSGTQYIDTGIIPGSTYGYEVKFYINNMSAETAQLGVWHAWGNGMWGHDCKYINNRILCVFGGKNNEYSGKLSQDIHTIKMFNGDFYFDGVLTKQVASGAFTCSGNATMFGIRVVSSSSVEYKNPQKIYSCKIFKDTESNLVRDFIPVRVGTTGYMYDRVSGELFGNAGTGDFILGSDIIMTSQSNPEVLAICYAQGWAAHSDYMTKSEAAAVTDIGTVFYNNQNITHFEELEYFGVTSFANTAFRNCSNLESVVLGTSVTSLGDSMFMSSGLKRLIINSTNITYWGTYSTFRSCPLEYIYSKSVTTTPAANTLNMQSLTTLVLDTTVRTAGGFRCPLLTDVTISEGVTTFSNTGFRGCTSLVSITLPSTTATFDEYMFLDCRALQRVTILAVTPPTGSITNSTFANVSNAIIYVPSGSVEMYKAASGWSRYASWIQAIPT